MKNTTLLGLILFAIFTGQASGQMLTRDEFIRQHIWPKSLVDLKLVLIEQLTGNAQYNKSPYEFRHKTEIEVQSGEELPIDKLRLDDFKFKMIPNNTWVANRVHYNLIVRVVWFKEAKGEEASVDSFISNLDKSKSAHLLPLKSAYYDLEDLSQGNELSDFFQVGRESQQTEVSDMAPTTELSSQAKEKREPVIIVFGPGLSWRGTAPSGANGDFRQIDINGEMKIVGPTQYGNQNIFLIRAGFLAGGAKVKLDNDELERIGSVIGSYIELETGSLDPVHLTLGYMWQKVNITNPDYDYMNLPGRTDNLLVQGPYGGLTFEFLGNTVDNVALPSLRLMFRLGVDTNVTEYQVGDPQIFFQMGFGMSYPLYKFKKGKRIP